MICKKPVNGKGKKTILVVISAFGLAGRFVRSGTYELKTGTRVKTLLRKAGLQRTPPPLIYMIEGNRVEPSRRLSDGEELKVLHAVGGG